MPSDTSHPPSRLDPPVNPPALNERWIWGYNPITIKNTYENTEQNETGPNQNIRSDNPDPSGQKRIYRQNAQIQLNQKLPRSPQLYGRICPGLPDLRRLQWASLTTVGPPRRGRFVSVLGMAVARSGGMGRTWTGFGAGSHRDPLGRRAVSPFGTPPVPQRGDCGPVLDLVHGVRGLHLLRGTLPPATSQNPR